MLRKVERTAGAVIDHADPPVTLLHDFHRQTRRLGVGLYTWEQVQPSRSSEEIRWLGGRLKRISRLVGQVRDRDVVLGLIRQAGSPTGSPAAVRRAHRFLARTRDEARTGRELLRVHLRTEATGGLFERVRAMISRPPDRARLARVDRLLGEEIAARRRRVDKAHRKAARKPTPVRLHRLRIRVRQFHHSRDLARSVRIRGTPRAVRALRALQRRLGDLHDLDVALASMGPELKDSTWARHLRDRRRGIRRGIRRATRLAIDSASAGRSETPRAHRSPASS